MKDDNMDLFKLIKDLAKIPSYSEHEEIIHPYIRQFAADYFPAETEIIEIRKNLFIKIPGTLDLEPIALSAHLDKTRHKDLPASLEIEEFVETEDEISGHLDDALGLGLCLYISKLYSQKDRPPIYLFLTELEEHGHLGAFRLKLYFYTNPSLHKTPWAIINFDVTPLGGTYSVLAVENNYTNGDLYTLFDVVPRTETMLSFHPNRSDYAIYSNFFDDSVSFCLEVGCRNLHRLVERAYKRDVTNALLVASNIIDNGLELYRKQLNHD